MAWTSVSSSPGAARPGRRHALLQMQSQGSRLPERGLYMIGAATMALDGDLYGPFQFRLAVPGHAGMPAFDIRAGRLDASGIGVPGCSNEDVRAFDAVLLDQMLHRDLRIAPIGKTRDDRMLHDLLPWTTLQAGGRCRPDTETRLPAPRSVFVSQLSLGAMSRAAL